MNTLRKQTRVLHGTAMLWLVAACGNESEFNNAAPPATDHQDIVYEPEAPVTPDPVPPTIEPKSFSLTWNWPCTGAITSDEVKEAIEKSSDLVGSGSHRVAANPADRIKLTINRQHCTVAETKRDIVFIVDTSGSMKDNDPKTGTTCGRFDAIQSIVRSFEKPENIRIGGVTFSDSATSSGVMMDTTMFLNSSIAASTSLCRNSGGTNYQSGLKLAIDLLSDAREGSVREVYFISDGEPNTGQEGAAEGAILKDKLRVGATIATLMIKGNDAQMMKIASADRNGVPLHRKTDNASELAMLIAELSRNKIEEMVFSYKQIGSDNWYEEQITDNLASGSAKLTLPEFTSSQFGRGLFFKVEYTDRHGITFVTEQSTLTFSAPPPANPANGNGNGKGNGNSGENGNGNGNSGKNGKAGEDKESGRDDEE
jgi:Mg-chelatase subunit ChlD